MNWGADVNNGQTEVIQRIQQILSSLPTGIRQPFVLRFDLSNIPVCLVTASGGGLDEKQLYDLAYNTIEPRSEEHTSELQSQSNLVCRLLLEKKKKIAPATSAVPPVPPRRSSPTH